MNMKRIIQQSIFFVKNHASECGFLGLVLWVIVSTVGFAAEDEKSMRLSITSRATITPIVELYTSEGCSSCPRADDFITGLGQTFDHNFHAVPLAFHVDYWDRLGWIDPYSKPEFTARQHEIGAMNKQRSIYTPEIVVSGKETSGGTNVVESIKQYNKQESVVTIRLDLDVADSDKLEAVFTVDNRAIGSDAVAYIAIYENDIVRNIAGGENKGRVLTHNFVVRYWSDPLRVATGITNKMLALSLGAEWAQENLGLAVVVLNRDTGKTLQAVSTPLHTLFQI